MPEDTSRKIAADVHTRFQFYVLGLTFGILALSVQTAAFDGQPVLARLAELIAWLLLLGSALFGLSRLEWVPQSYVVGAFENDVEGRAQSLRKAALQGAASVHVLAEGRERSIDDLLAQADMDRKLVKERRQQLNRWEDLKYKAQRATFVAALIALMIARGYKPAVEIITALKQ